MMNNTAKFNDKAAPYSAARPAYATAFLQWLYADMGFSDRSVVADIGSGTGIFTKQLLERGGTVYAVEPNGDMRAAAEAALSSFANFRSVNGTAEQTTLGDCSVDHITVAQAFHWFNALPFQRECGRILKPNGKIFLIYNARDASSAFSLQQKEICRAYCPSFAGFNGGVAENDEKIAKFFGGRFRRIAFENPLAYDKNKFIQRSLSSSYSPNKQSQNYRAYIAALEELYDRFAENGTLQIPNKTVAYYGVLGE